MRIEALAAAPGSRSSGSRSCSGRSSAPRAGPPRPSISTRPRAATWCATWSAWRPRAACAFDLPEQFPQNSLMAARLALIGADEGWSARLHPRRLRGRVRARRDISDRQALGCHPASLHLDSAEDFLAHRRAGDQGASASSRRRRRRSSASSALPRSWSARSCSGATIDSSRRWAGPRAVEQAFIVHSSDSAEYPRRVQRWR